MPSVLDLFEGGDRDPPAGLEPRPGVLASVKSEGGRRRTGRRRRTAVLALLGLVAVGVPVAALTGRDGAGPRPVDLAAAGDGHGPAPTADPAALPTIDPVPPATMIPMYLTPEATLPIATIPVPTQPSAAVAPSSPVPTSPAKSPAGGAARGSTQTSTTKARVCRNSVDPACGAFRWDPAPAPNRPLAASFATAPATAVAGRPVPFQVTWSDADAAAIVYDHLSTDGSALGPACSIVPRHGPWTPPAPAPGRGTLSYSPTFPSAGTYTVTVSLGTDDCSSPYGSDNHVEATIVVTAPAPKA